jgi:hypothetical protein
MHQLLDLWAPNDAHVGSAAHEAAPAPPEAGGDWLGGSGQDGWAVRTPPGPPEAEPAAEAADGACRQTEVVTMVVKSEWDAPPSGLPATSDVRCVASTCRPRGRGDEPPWSVSF